MKPSSGHLNQALLLLLLGSSLLSRLKVPDVGIGIHFILMGSVGLVAIIHNWPALIREFRCHESLH